MPIVCPHQGYCGSVGNLGGMMVRLAPRGRSMLMLPSLRPRPLMQSHTWGDRPAAAAAVVVDAGGQDE
jgi:hypothetical protein